MTLPVVLLTGATGQVGGHLQEDLQQMAKVSAPGRDELDLRNAESIRDAVARTQPRWIVHPAAYTAVDKAESDRETCFAVNAEATRVFAEEARRADALLVTFSTDYVFDGSGDQPHCEEDPTGPLNVYGESKLQAERYMAESGCRYLNLRTSWVYSARGHNFVKTMLKLAREREELKVVDDQHGAPSSAANLSATVVAMLQAAPDAAKLGPYHVCGTGFTTWFGFASHVIDTARELQPEKSWARVTPVPGSHYPTPAKRPGNSRLDCAKLQQNFGLALPPWQDSVRSVVEKLLQPS